MPRRPLGFNAAAHERHHWWRSLLLRLAICGGLSWLLWRSFELSGLVISLFLWGRAFAGDLLDLSGVVWRGLRLQAFKPVQGHYYQFKGHRIRVVDDELLPQRWLALDDLAEALGSPMPAASLRHRAPQGVVAHRDGVYALDEVVLGWLREQRSDRAIRLALWVERDVWHPVRGRKAGYAQKGAPAPRPGAPEE